MMLFNLPNEFLLVSIVCAKSSQLSPDGSRVVLVMLAETIEIEDDESGEGAAVFSLVSFLVSSIGDCSSVRGPGEGAGGGGWSGLRQRSSSSKSEDVCFDGELSIVSILIVAMKAAFRAGH